VSKFVDKSILHFFRKFFFCRVSKYVPPFDNSWEKMTILEYSKSMVYMGKQAKMNREFESLSLRSYFLFNS